jgi:hypothetical protein
MFSSRRTAAGVVKAMTEQQKKLPFYLGCPTEVQLFDQRKLIKMK